jgi:hypothetical protein
MRRYLYLAVAAPTALLMALSAAPALAATHDVLTTGKVGGTNVKVGAILKAGLAKGTSAGFFNTSSGTMGVKCTKSSFSAKVTANPAKPGTAKESLTTQSFSSCTSNIAGVTSVKSVKLANLPYKVTVSDASGFPVKVSGTSSSKPLKTTIVLNTVIGTVTCVYSVASISGKASNSGNTNSFSKQKFKKSSGPSTCFSSGFFTAKYGPITNSSVKGSPKVFVN